MPNTFNTTRTPGSRSSAYDLVDHIAESNPHPQYLLKSDYQGGGSGSLDLEIHKSDPNAHGDNYVKPAALNNYYTKAEIDANFYTKTYIDTNIYTKAQVDELLKEIDVSGVALYHDPANDDSEEHAASMKAANVVYNLITDHITRFSQSASLTNHLDDSGLELYAHRIHKHGFTDLSGVASANHNHDDRYSLLSHNHDDRYALIAHSHNYLSEEDLALVGVYPHTLEGTSDSDSDGTVIPFNFNEGTTQGNISLAPDVMNAAINGPNVGSVGSTSFLNIVTNIVTEDTVSDSGVTTYGEQNCSQTLYTSDGVYTRIGHRNSGTLAEGADETTLWTFTEWTSMGGGAKDIFEVFYSTTTTTPRGAFPLWTGETIINCKTLYPTFWERALEYQTNGTIRVVSSTVYNQEVSTYGECGAFVIDTNAGSIRLPKITRFVSSLDAISGIGVTLPAGLPNITGTFGGVSRRANNRITPTGAFTSLREPFDWGPSGDEASYANEIRFNAATSSNIYGSANTVQPPSVRLALYIQVFNTITPTATTDLEARVGVLEANAIMFSRHDFTTSGWTKNSGDLYEYIFNTSHFTSAHIYMIESGGSVLVDESVEVHIVGSTESGDIQRQVKLVAPQAFTGYIITLG